MARLPAVSLAARDRDYPGALASLGRVVAALASVPGLLSTVAQAEDLLRRELARRDELSGKARDAMVRDEKRFVAWKEALAGLLAGDPARVTGRLAGHDDEVTGSPGDREEARRGEGGFLCRLPQGIGSPRSPRR